LINSSVFFLTVPSLPLIIPSIHLITMESEDTEQPTMTHHPSELLRQIASSTDGSDTEISVTVPMITTWKTVLHVVDSALGDLDGRVMIIEKRSRAQRERLRQVALENMQFLNSSSSVTVSPGLPIRTKYDVKSLPFQSDHHKRREIGLRMLRCRSCHSASLTTSFSTRPSRKEHCLS